MLRTTGWDLPGVAWRDIGTPEGAVSLAGAGALALSSDARSQSI